LRFEPEELIAQGIVTFESCPARHCVQLLRSRGALRRGGLVRIYAGTAPVLTLLGPRDISV
jgi:hypothetical protein